jgi:chromosome partitioning protein
MPMHEACTVCGRSFDVQFRYQMAERDGGFAFYCSQACHGAALRGEAQAGVPCDACHTSFRPELVAQILTLRGARKYACSEACRSQLLAEAQGVRLGQLAAPEAMPAVLDPASAGVPSAPAPSQSDPGVSSIAPVTRIGGARYEGPRTLAVFNHKGGTGKTTTSVSIAAGLAARGLRVLLVDTDSQGNVGVSLDVKAERSLYHVLVMGLAPATAITNVRPGFDVLPANETLAAAELYLAGRQNRDRVLRDRLAKAQAEYDVVVLDCSPSLSLLNQNALVAADAILVPVACDFLSLVGVRQVIKTVKSVNSLLHHPVKIWGVLPTFYDARARICRDAVETLEQHFGDRCLAPIRAGTRIKEAPAQGKTIFEHAPDSNAAEDYAKVVDALVAGEVRATPNPEAASA